jgi:hypothetical protein
MRFTAIGLLAMMATLGNVAVQIRAQEIGFLEEFALAKDRSAALQQLIPGSEDYFYYNSLHLQNTARLAESESMIDQWALKFPASPMLLRMQTRQRLLSYSDDPKRTLEYLRRELNLLLEHAPPQADRARDLPTALDPALLDQKKLIDQSIAQDVSLSKIRDSGLLTLLDRELSIEQVRAILTRIKWVDVPGIVDLIARELRAKDSAGWNAFPIHGLLTLEQRQELAKSLPQLLENDVFVRQYLTRLLPNADTSVVDADAQREHLDRLESFVDTLPASQNSLRGIVLYHRLQLDARSEKFDRARFIKYLALPRNQPYYSQEFLKSQSQTPLLAFDAKFLDETFLPPIADDSSLIRLYLEHFFQNDASVDAFSQWLDRGFLHRVFVETKILYGIGSSSEWYAQVDASQQKEIRDRVELRFGSNSTLHYKPDDDFSLTVDIKNISKLVVRVYQIDPRNVFRRTSQSVSRDIDLDGLIANSEQTITYENPADRRHRERISIPQCEGSGVWVIDLLGGGLRGRAVVFKGQLRSTQRLTDAGHEFRIYDDSGNTRPTATVELGTRSFTADKDGAILVPYSEQDAETSILLVDGPTATVESFQHRREAYELEIGVLVESQNLLSGAKGGIVVRPQLLCNDVPVPIQNLEDAQIVIVTTNQDGIQSTQTVPIEKLSSEQDIAHQFLVPHRLRNVSVTLNGKVLAVSRNTRESVTATKSIAVNEMAATAQIADFYLIHDSEGYLLQVRGRNGEPISRLPVTLNIWPQHLDNPVTVTLATDAVGQVQLGVLAGVRNFQVSADNMEPRAFYLETDSVDWPARIQIAQGQSCELPIAESSLDYGTLPRWSLFELRANLITANRSDKVSVRDGRVAITPLDSGNYILNDRVTGQTCEVHVAKGVEHQGFVIGPAQTIQRSPAAVASVAESEFKNGTFRVRVAGANATTRVHLVASPYVSDSRLAAQLRMTMYPIQSRLFSAKSVSYVDSLQLDDEYQYVLQRQYATKYPGNLLAQPSLLLNPWDIETAVRQLSEGLVRGGVGLPEDPVPHDPSELMMTETPRIIIPEEDSPQSVYDFLGIGAKLLVNRMPDDAGWIEVPQAALEGCHSLTVVVVGAQGVATKTIRLPSTRIPLAELRLAKSFAEDKHLSQQQRVRIVEANQKTDLGDARSTRVQAYSSLRDVERLYGTLLPSDEFKKFSKLTRWNDLSDDEKLAAYNELACHELHVFLYLKDRPFFDKVVRPYLENKFASQVIDEYLLERDSAEFRDLWQLGRLNTFERILISARNAEMKTGMRKWISDAIDANKIDPAIRMTKFQVALAGSALDVAAGSKVSFFANENSDHSRRLDRAWGAIRSDSTLGNASGSADDDFAQIDRQSGGKDATKAVDGRELEESEVDYFFDKRVKENQSWNENTNLNGAFLPELRSVRSKLALGRTMLFRSLDATREWAETQFHRIALSQQHASLVPPSPMWLQLADRDSLSGFLSDEFHLSSNTLTECLLGLALLDLPFDSPQLQLSVEEGRLLLNCPARCVVFVESIEESQLAKDSEQVLIGQDIYLVSPPAEVDPQKPISHDALVRGTGYRASVVVTNPSGMAKSVSVLTQIPQGAIPLGGGKLVQSHLLNLAAYSTQQVQYAFYFPSVGEFTFYGAQAAIAGVHAASADFQKVRVLDRPEVLETETWSYVALWGTDDQVLEFLGSHNTQQLRLELIAFRMQDKSFFEQCLAELDSQGVFNDTLWAYSIRHADTKQIGQFLSHNSVIVDRIGPVRQSPLMKIDSADRYEFEHLDYRPLVNARSHQLGAKRTILNERFAVQYDSLLERLAYQGTVSASDEMSVTYYMLLQNRIDEALAHFDAVDRKSLDTQLQYDYFDAYLDFYRGRYERAAQIAERYTGYNVPRWRDLFAQIRLQVAQHTAMVNGTEPPSSDSILSDVTDPIQRMLLDSRQSNQATLAGDAPAIELKMTAGKLNLNYQNVKEVDVQFYLMDIELLFSRNPFVQQDGGSLVLIQPNDRKQIALTENRGLRTIEIPAALANRNLLVEVSAEALTQRQVIYANSMDVTVIDSFGRLQVTTANGLAVEEAYVKIYARHNDGQVRFYKDGYTDLRGQFDFASLSTNELDSVQRFAILVMHPDRGALIREAAPPKK